MKPNRIIFVFLAPCSDMPLFKKKTAMYSG